VEPMGPDKKLRFFEALVKIGLKEIEVGFPAASQTDFDFVRVLIEENHIPKDVTIQVLTQAREHLIGRTFESIKGARRAIVHLYNSTNELQRRVVFAMDKKAIRELAVQGTVIVRKAARELPASTEVVFEYTPESFSATEVDFAAEVSDAVAETWGPTADRKMILNLPATVEMSTPNVYADQVEWMHRNLRHRDRVILSVHAHNDRGEAVAATELAMLAGAERVEGTLFGNGERTGNVDLINVAMNLYSQGIEPGLDLSNMPALVDVFESCNQMSIPARHPYAGELVFTAFSGSHQDAIRKGLDALDRTKSAIWEVPYLPIDPSDVGRVYEPLIRINSQSGKGGVSYVLERSHGYRVPKELAIEFSKAVQRVTDATGKELMPDAILELFEKEYLGDGGRFALGEYTVARTGPNAVHVTATVTDGGAPVTIEGHGNGPIDAFVHAIAARAGKSVRLTDYSEHALGDGADAEAVSYVQTRTADGRKCFGVGRNADIVTASLVAVVSAINRLDKR
jgi:2-isopropylmalate synthase